MKYILFAIQVILLPVFLSGQTFTTTDFEEHFSQPHITTSHSIYFLSEPVNKQGTSSVQEQLVTRKTYAENRLIKLEKFVDEQAVMTVEKFYKNGNLSKCIVGYNGRKKDFYYYTYDHNNKLVKTIGYKGGKVIFQETVTEIKNTVVTNRIEKSPSFNRNDKEYRTVSKDSLSEVLISKADGETDVTIKHFNEKKQLISQLDSSSHFYEYVSYHYDSTGRIREIQWRDDVIRRFQRFQYNAKETIMSEYGVYYGAETQEVLQGSQISQYGDDGMLQMVEIQKYSKGENGFYPSGIIRKYYIQNRLHRLVKTRDDREQVYIIKYH